MNMHFGSTDLLPLILVEHGFDAPPGPEQVQRFGETVVIDGAGVNRENTHH